MRTLFAKSKFTNKYTIAELTTFLFQQRHFLHTHTCCIKQEHCRVSASGILLTATTGSIAGEGKIAATSSVAEIHQPRFYVESLYCADTIHESGSFNYDSSQAPFILFVIIDIIKLLKHEGIGLLFYLHSPSKQHYKVAATGNAAPRFFHLTLKYRTCNHAWGTIPNSGAVLAI